MKKTVELLDEVCVFVQERGFSIYDKKLNMNMTGAKITLEVSSYNDEFKPDTEEFNGKKLSVVKNIIDELEKAIGSVIPIKEIIKRAAEEDISNEESQEAIEKLKRSGEVFEPKPYYIQNL